MKRSIAFVAFCGIWLGAGVVYAGHLKEYFPLQKGNVWTLYNQEKSKKWTMEVTGAQGSSYLLKGFPWGGNYSWVAFSGNTLYRWNSTQKKWQAFLPFGGPLGYKITLHTGSSVLSSTTVEVVSAGSSVENPVLGMKKSACKRFELVGDLWSGFWDSFGLPSLGTYHIDFAPKLGPWGVAKGWSSAYLGYARLNGQNFGLVEFSKVASGEYSADPLELPLIFLIKDPQVWGPYYQLHTGNTTVPNVDFSKHSVLLALTTPKYRKVGSYVEIKKLRWDYPTTGKVTASFQLVHPPASTGWGWNSPYLMLLVPASVSQVTGTWIP